MCLLPIATAMVATSHIWRHVFVVGEDFSSNTACGTLDTLRYSFHLQSIVDVYRCICSGVCPLLWRSTCQRTTCSMPANSCLSLLTHRCLRLLQDDCGSHGQFSLCCDIKTPRVSRFKSGDEPSICHGIFPRNGHALAYRYKLAFAHRDTRIGFHCQPSSPISIPICTRIVRYLSLVSHCNSLLLQNFAFAKGSTNKSTLDWIASPCAHPSLHYLQSPAEEHRRCAVFCFTQAWPCLSSILTPFFAG